MLGYESTEADENRWVEAGLRRKCWEEAGLRNTENDEM